MSGQLVSNQIMVSESYARIWQSPQGPIKVYQNLYASRAFTTVIRGMRTG